MESIDLATAIYLVSGSLLTIGGVLVARHPKLKNSKFIKGAGNILRILSRRPEKKESK
jgi:hypothetical protein